MKRAITIILALVLSASFCMAQGIQTERLYQEAIENAEKSFAAGRYDEAIQYCKTALELKPGNAAVINHKINEINKAKEESLARGERYRNAIASAERNFGQRNYEEAEQYYKTALKIKPESAAIINPKLAEIGRLLLEKRYQDAIASAEISFEQGQYSEAQRHYSTAFKIKPENAASYNSRMTELDRLVLEEAAAAAASELNQRYEDALASAQENFDRGQYALAKQDYLTALGLKPENADFINSKIAEIGKSAQLNLYRKGNITTILEDNYDVLLDDMVVGRTKNKWKTTITVDDFGAKTVSATIDGRQAAVNIEFKPGRIYYVLCSVTSRSVKTGVTGTRTNKKTGMIERYEETVTEYTPKLELMEMKLGEREFNSIKAK